MIPKYNMFIEIYIDHLSIDQLRYSYINIYYHLTKDGRLDMNIMWMDEYYYYTI